MAGTIGTQLARLVLKSKRNFALLRVTLKRWDNHRRWAGYMRSVGIRVPGQRLKLNYPILLAIIPVLMAESEKSKMDLESLLKQADKLYQETDYKKIYNLLSPYKDDNNDEVLWRLARSAFEVAKFEKSLDDRNKLNEEALAYAEKALEINDGNYAVHKWMAILIDAVSEAKGTKARISQSERSKFHIKKATELNPMDATSFYMLGVWCFSFADLPWYQRKIASVIFATPPTSSYEEALDAFMQAEKIDPQFYSMNLLMLGKTFMKLGNAENAARYLLEAKNFPLKTEDDKQAQKEAMELLKSMGIE